MADRNLLLPLAKNENGEVVGLHFHPHVREHCYLSGWAGSGKSNLLRVITEEAVGLTDAIAGIWCADPKGYGDIVSTLLADRLSSHHKDSQDYRKSCVIKISSSREMTRTELNQPVDAMDRFIRRLYDESERRVHLYADRQTDEMAAPRYLLAVVCSTHVLKEYFHQKSVLNWMLEEVIGQSNVTGIKLIFESQCPIAHSGLTPSIQEACNIRIAMRASAEEISETLGKSDALSDEKTRRVITGLSVGKPGEFIMNPDFHNGERPLLCGRAPYLWEDSLPTWITEWISALQREQ